nr:phosphoethanolamine N-methyltransferase-like [Procambarus clarkii]XP_045583281.1 phosphoethanolamine N-methyltransferase-like [Procambarus clarkii]XP_045583282.1 phosphoethanolamine N-methyltransferase-like [Procambarus clarkii]
MAQLVSKKGDEEEEEEFLRQKMTCYWQAYNPTLESMMLSQDAKYLAQNEQNEVLSYLPDYHGKNVLELGAGIGRFTASLATVAGHVTAVDFMEQYIAENRKQNQHLDNVIFRCDDVTKLDFPAGSFDLVFSNWLFMYLSDVESSRVFRKILSWLTPGGHFFLRESCYHQSGNIKRKENPTLYRTPLQYFSMLQDVSSDNIGYKIIRGKNILAYVQYHGNPNQLCFLVRRVENKGLDPQTQYLESHFAVESIKSRERIYGYNWFSTGGEYTTRDLCAGLGLRPGWRVLDVGCGTGGSAFFMARHYGVHVHGVDLSSNMIHLGIERQGKLEPEVRKKIQFEISDILQVEYEADSYDLVYSRDSILYIADKLALFKKLYRWLKPGGTLFITDFYTASSHPPYTFLHHVNNVKYYSLLTGKSYGETLGEAGFVDVRFQDLGHELIKILGTELDAFTATREAFVKDFSQEVFDDISASWRDKIHWAREGQLSWGAFKARKVAPGHDQSPTS